ncbi:N-succinylglutamate 5-semialdehyde dehydrogenase [Kushneria pakistanensis]|uniref:N-succinylglutamate 5-semialdehyde dehydrogenase n=1 Tax=Kushneria pakistanensis TaxID=1508770 RepID=A0ABQ3F917_9GAMM|nr:N-succinylglutamate 5-semialdehyde dehydrogenase [Kushneria pakistanensis]
MFTEDEMSIEITQQLLVGGQWVSGEGDAFDKHDPVSGERLWQGRGASATQVDRAVIAAREAFPAWARQPLEARIALLEAFRERLEHYRNVLADTIARETGKPRWEAGTEVQAMIGKIAISIAAWHERTPTRVRDNAGVRAVVRHRPHGVMAVFGPYNFPGHLPNGHIVPALLAGNTVVFKPSELTPATADLVLSCWQEAGLPSGVINLVQGGIETGQALAGHAGIDGLLFTGSEGTGRRLHEGMGGRLETVLALELGGNNPLLVHDVPDNIEAAVLTIVQSAYLSGGQRCTCARRLLVPEGDQGDRLIEALQRSLATLVVGPQFDGLDGHGEQEPFYSGLVSPAAAQKMLDAQQQLESMGARVLSRMAFVKEGASLVSPGLIDVTGIDVPDEEYFGPLLKVTRFKNWEAAIDEANNTRFGLAAGLIGGTSDIWEDFVLRIRAGIVNWNRQTTGAASDAPFGGVGASGNHRPSAWYAADYCAWPVASMESDTLVLPDQLPPGVTLAGLDGPEAT